MKDHYLHKPVSWIGLLNRKIHPEACLGKSTVSAEKAVIVYWVGALILTIGIRLYLFTNYYTINPDGVRYIEAARHFWEGKWLEGLASFYPPLFPLMIALIFPVVGDWEIAGQVWPFILGVLILLPLFGLLRRVYGLRVAQVALFFYGVSLYLARLSLEVRTEIPYIFFLILTLYLLRRGLESGRSLTFFFIGMCSALAYLIRPEGLLLIPVGVFFLIFQKWFADRVERNWLKSSIVVLGFVLFSVPYVLYLKWDTGDWLLSRKTGYQLSEGLAKHDAETAELRLKKSDRVSISHLISSRPLTYAKKVFIDAFRAFGFYLQALHYSYLPFLFIGWFFFFRGKFWVKDEFLLIAVVFLHLAVVSLFYVTRRYEVALAALSLGWVAAGYLTIEGYFQSSWGKRSGLITAFILGLFAIGTLPKTLQPIGWDKLYLREAGLYLKQKPGNPTILTPNGRVAFYAAGQNQIRVVQQEDFPASLAAQEGDYLALSDGALTKLASRLNDYGWFLDREFSSNDETDKFFVFRRMKI